MPRRKKSSNYIQGIYRPTNPSKYAGVKSPRYLSSWELKFFRWCDNNDRVIKWGSETCKVPYISPVDGKMHKYLVDNVVHMITKSGKVDKYLIEIKPKKQTKPPTKHGNKKKTTIIYEHTMYAINQAKWHAARMFCKKHNYQFVILTEDELFS
jgi:hypothetical protein